ncbi:MAG: hypothetical protein MI862_25850 [Desulfobacterales bacterium]|nr:hypothetical protein [Desulfobacterales bacterium]
MNGVVAKIINVRTKKSISFNEGNAYIGGWDLASNWGITETEILGMDGSFIDDFYISKKSNQISLVIHITCSSAEETKNIWSQISSVMSGKIQLFLFDNRYTYAYVSSSKVQDFENDSRYIDVVYNLKANVPYFIKEIEEEWIVTPNDYPTRIEMENPHSSANVKFGNYNTTTGVLITTENDWECVDSATAGSKVILSGTIGDGVEFDCIGGFALRSYNGDLRKYKVFIDGVFETEVIGDTSDQYMITYEKSFTDQSVHRILLIVTNITLTIDYIDLIPSSLQTLQNTGSVSDYPKIEVESVDTKAVFSPLGKTASNTDHPVTIWGIGIGKNLFDDSQHPDTQSSLTTYTLLENGVRVSNGGDTTYRRIAYKYKLKPNSVYTFSRTATVVSGTSAADVRIIPGEEDPLGSIGGCLITGAGKQSTTYETSDSEEIWIVFFSSTVTATPCVVDYTDIAQSIARRHPK